MAIQSSLLVSLLIAVQAPACLPIIHEQEMDLSDFEEFELDHSQEDGLHYLISPLADGSHAFTVRFEDELVLERALSSAELGKVRSASEKVTLRKVLDDGEMCCAEPGAILFIRWDDVRADTWWGYESGYDIEDDVVETFFKIMETLRKADAS